MGSPIEAFSLWRHGIGKVLGSIPMKSTFSHKFLHLGWPSNFTKRQNCLSKRSHNPECLPNRSGEVTTVCHIQCSNIHPIWPIWLRHKIWRTNCWNTWTFFSLLATPTSFSCYTTVRTFLDTHVCVCTPTAKVIQPFGRQHFTCYSFFRFCKFSFFLICLKNIEKLDSLLST